MRDVRREMDAGPLLADGRGHREIAETGDLFSRAWLESNTVQQADHNVV